jgi:hypothetical protein
MIEHNGPRAEDRTWNVTARSAGRWLLSVGKDADEATS